MASSTSNEATTAPAEDGTIHRTTSSPIVVLLQGVCAYAVFEVGGAK